MKYFVKVDGKLVEATPEQVKNLKLDLFLEDGTQIRIAKEEEDPLKDLVGAIGGLTEKVSTMAETQKTLASKNAELEKAVEGYKKAAARGFPIDDPTKGKVEGGEDYEGLKKILGPYSLEYQGKRLMDKIHHPNHQIDEKTRIELAKYWALVVRAGFKNDPEALQLFRKLYGEVHPDSKTAIGDSGNTFPIPDIIEAEILAFARERSIILQFARMWDMTSEYQSWPQEDAAVSVGWGNTTAESEPTVTEFQLTAYELSAYAAVKNMTLADSRSDIVSWLTETMGEASGLEIDNKGFNGTGSDSPFICSGILSAACGYSVVMGSGSTAFSQLDATVLSEMIAKLDGVKKAGGRFWLHGVNLHYIRSLKDSQNRPIFIETVGAPVSGTIWGYPYSEVIKAPSTSAANTAFMAFGNMRYFAVGRRLDTAALSVDPYGLWTTNRTRFKIYQRWGLGMGLPKGFVRLLTSAS